VSGSTADRSALGMTNADAEATPEHPAGSPSVTLETQAARGGAWLAVSALLTKGSQIFLLLALAVLLDPRDLGVLAIGTLVFNFLLVVQDLGITDVINRSWERGEDRAEQIARTALTITLGGATLLTAGVWVLAPLLAEVISSPRSTWIVRFMVLPLPIMAVSWVQMARMQRDMAFQRRVVPDAVPALLGAVITIVLALAGNGPWSMVVGNAVTCVSSPICAHLVGYRIRPGWDSADAKEMLRWGRHSTPAAALVLLTLNIDYILVARYLGDQRLGYYSLAFRICFVPHVLVVTVLNAAAFPYYCRMPDKRSLHAAVENVLTILSTLVFPMCAALLLLAPAVELLGLRWGPAEGAVRGLAVYAGLNAVAHTVQLPLKAVGRVQAFFYAQLAHLAILFVTLFIFTPHGVTAVGVAQALSALLILLISQLMLTRATSFSWHQLIRSQKIPFLGVCAMTAAYFAVRATGLAANTWIGLALFSVACFGAYAGAVYVFGRRVVGQSAALLRGRSL